MQALTNEKGTGEGPFLRSANNGEREPMGWNKRMQ